MFLVHDGQRDIMMSLLAGDDTSVHRQVSLSMQAPFFAVELLISDGVGRRSDTVFLTYREQVLAIKEDDSVLNATVLLVSPARLNRGKTWAMDELAEIWEGDLVTGNGRGAVRYKLKDGRTLIDGEVLGDAQMQWHPLYRC